MKEATGELNLTVVVVLIVAALASFFFGVLWPRLRSNFNANTKCDEAICDTCPEKDSNGNCTIPESGMVTCHLKGEVETFTCQWKG